MSSADAYRHDLDLLPTYLALSAMWVQGEKNIRNNTWTSSLIVNSRSLFGSAQVVSSFIGTSGSSLLIFCIHVHSGPIYWGVIYHAKKL
jgi:hypothetical protein